MEGFEGLAVPTVSSDRPFVAQEKHNCEPMLDSAPRLASRSGLVGRSEVHFRPSRCGEAASLLLLQLIAAGVFVSLMAAALGTRGS